MLGGILSGRFQVALVLLFRSSFSFFNANHPCFALFHPLPRPTFHWSVFIAAIVATVTDIDSSLCDAWSGMLLLLPSLFRCLRLRNNTPIRMFLQAVAVTVSIVFLLVPLLREVFILIIDLRKQGRDNDERSKASDVK